MADQPQCRVLLLLFSILASTLQIQVHGSPQVPCYFIFGDSLADNGNNNMRSTEAKANYPPYGVDLPEGPTGRFTNKHTIVDVITQLVGFDGLMPPFVNAKGQEVLTGVNYASAAAGILDETGKNQGDIISLSHQLSNHLVTISSINASKEYLSKCLYTVGMGSNDFINNYFLPGSASSKLTPRQFSHVLVKQYTQQLKNLYSYGARKVAIFGLGLIGGAPGIVRRLGAKATAVTAASQLFTNKLPGLVNDLNKQLPGAKFTYINISGITLTSPELATLNAKDTCCEVVDKLFTCAKDRPPCPNRSQFAFFDGYHPTHVVNVAMARRAYNEKLPTDSLPYDIHSLTQL